MQDTRTTKSVPLLVLQVGALAPIGWVLPEGRRMSHRLFDGGKVCLYAINHRSRAHLDASDTLHGSDGTP